jgi:hypothetical protein
MLRTLKSRSVSFQWGRKRPGFEFFRLAGWGKGGLRCLCFHAGKLMNQGVVVSSGKIVLKRVHWGSHG